MKRHGREAGHGRLRRGGWGEAFTLAGVDGALQSSPPAVEGAETALPEYLSREKN